MLAKKGLMTAPAAVAQYVEDVFSTYLYTGNSSTQTITNGIDLSGEGGLVWIKGRSGATGHRFTDTVRGATKSLASNSTVAEATESTGLTAFSGTGFTIGADADYNTNAATYCSWTFRKAEKFFDVVTYTGNGSNRTISHNLGSVPGCIIVKRTDTTGDWQVYHRANTANPETDYLVLNTTAATADSDTRWNDTLPTSTVFSLGTDATVNANSGTYVAYLFAHDAGGFGDDGDQSVIKCGSYTGNGSTTGPTIDLGWEPQWVLIKQSTQSGNRWTVTDNMRGFPVTSAAQQQILQPHNTDAEVGVMYIQPTSTGFKVVDVDADVNSSGETYIYIAIRRGPMKTPTDATKVFTPTVYTGTNVDNRLIDTTIAPDFVMIRQRDDTVVPGMYTGAQLTGQEFLITGSTNAGATDADSFDAQIVSAVEYGNAFSSMSGVWVGNDTIRKFNANTTSNNHVIHAFKRAPGFFDVVCYTGTGSAQSISHNLGVTPEFVITKRRSTAEDWFTWGSNSTSYMKTNANSLSQTNTAIFNGASSTTFNVGSNAAANASGETFIALLFASCSGVSKVGTYTGNGSNQTINCGFTNGARYVLIKRTDDAGDWCVFDSARGIVAGDDPFVQFNSTAAEVTNEDAVDTANSGFVINETTEALNTNNATYIYLAIA